MAFLCHYARLSKGFEVHFSNANGRVWYKLGRELGSLLKREKWNKVAKWNIWTFTNGHSVSLRGLIQSCSGGLKKKKKKHEKAVYVTSSNPSFKPTVKDIWYDMSCQWSCSLYDGFRMILLHAGVLWASFITTGKEHGLPEIISLACEISRPTVEF